MLSDLKKLVEQTEDFQYLARAEELAPSRALLRVITIQRDHLRREVDENPRFDNEIKKDVRYQLGMIRMANWLLSLPETSREYQKSIDRREG